MFSPLEGNGVTAETRGTRRASSPPRITSTRLWIGYAVMLVVFGLGAASLLPKTLRSVMEGVVLGLAVAALVTHPSIASVLRSMGVRARYGAGCLVLILVLAHVAKVTALTFPFVDWRMFGRSSQGQPEGLRFTAMRADGSSQRMVLGAAISDATVSRLDGMVRKQLESGTRDRLEQLIDAAVELEALDSTKSPVVRVMISKCVTTVENPEVTQCAPLETISTSSGRDRP